MFWKERRKHKRLYLNIPIQVWVEDKEQKDILCTLSSVNLSAGGAYLCYNAQDEEEAFFSAIYFEDNLKKPLNISFAFAAEQKEFICPAQIRRIEPSGTELFVAVEFVGFDENTRQELMDIIKKYESSKR